MDEIVRCVLAFQVGDYKLVVQMLAEVQHPEAITCTANIVGLNRSGVSLLHLAAYHGWLDIVASLRIKVDNKDSLGQTPLHYAAARGNLNVVMHLYTKQRQEAPGHNLIDYDGSLPLHLACSHGHLSVAEYLITKQKCNPSSQNKNGYTPLHFASQHGHMNIVQYLTKVLGCDPVGKKSTFLCFTHFSFHTYKATSLSTEQRCLPLHLACIHGHLSVVKYYIDELECEPTIPGEFKATPLHYACIGGQLNIVQYLCTKKCCHLKYKYSCQQSPISFACKSGHLNIIKYFTALKNFNPNHLLDNGGTLLHLAAHSDNVDVIKYLINECGCRETLDGVGILPVHYACIWGNLNTIKCFINKQNCNDPSCRDLIGRTPLHHACAGGHMNIIHCLVIELGCDPRIANKTGTLPIHIACQAGHLDVLKYFIAKQKSDRTVRGRNGWTPLHYATKGGHMNIIKYLITELECDPLTADDNSTTILQVATDNDHVKIVEWLLHNGWFSTQDIDKVGKICIDVAKHTRKRYKLLKLFQPLAKIAKTFDIHTFSKVILIGNGSAGKSTLARVISERATTYFNFFRFGNVLQVETDTAGIVPASIKSWEIGKIVLYDLAGQTEYHSSHSALMEIAMQQFPATFILVVDLNDGDAEIIQKLHYWLNFADNATSRSDNQSCLIVIGSHADLLSNEKITEKHLLVANTLKEISFLRYFDVIAMDCRKINSSATREFVQLLCKSHETVLDRAPKMSYYCHLLYAFLQYEQIVVCTLEYLAALLAEDDDCPIPLKYSFLTELLVTLSNKGLVVFLKNMDIVEKSWIVADTDVLLKDINGILFAPKEFKEHHEVSSSTGIVRSSSLQPLLPRYNLQMLVNFLELLEICHRVDLSGITTNLQQIGGSSSNDYHHMHKSLLFFPCLLEIQRSSVLLPCEEEMFSNWFGWCLSCKHQNYCFFTSRFLHVLLLRLVHTFPLADSDVTASAHHQQKRCTVWTNGVSWDNEEGIRTVVELIDQNQRVVVVMSHMTESRPLECSKHRSAVIRLIRDLKKELFPKLNVDEYLISPKRLKKWLSEDMCLPDKVLCPMGNVAKSLLLQKPYILSLKGMYGHLSTKETLLNEPYYQLSAFSMRELLDEGKADEPVSQNLLNEVNTNCKFSLNLSEQRSHLSLREVIEEFSIFSGLDPIVSALLCRVIMYLFWILYRNLQVKLPVRNSLEKLQKVLINVLIN